MLMEKDCNNAINNVFSYLDTLDLNPYINTFKNKKVEDLMDKLEVIFPYKDGFSETLFDAIAEDEFVDYLNKKYNLDIREETISCHYIRLC